MKIHLDAAEFKRLILVEKEFYEQKEKHKQELLLLKNELKLGVIEIKPESQGCMDWIGESSFISKDKILMAIDEELKHCIKTNQLLNNKIQEVKNLLK